MTEDIMSLLESEQEETDGMNKLKEMRAIYESETSAAMNKMKEKMIYPL